MKLVELLEKVPVSHITMEGERYKAAVEQIDVKLKDWYKYRSNAVARRARENTLQRLSVIAAKS
ncbi:MAG: hypothetical protein R2877_06395 [Bdellovibrionota bacterium]